MKTDLPLRLMIIAYTAFVVVLAVWLAVAPNTSPRHAPRVPATPSAPASPHAPHTVQATMHGRPVTCVLTVDSRGDGSLNNCQYTSTGETR